eukprot:1303603-Prymnesium_polylepis.1
MSQQRSTPRPTTARYSCNRTNRPHRGHVHTRAGRGGTLHLSPSGSTLREPGGRADTLGAGRPLAHARRAARAIAP